MDIKTIYKFIQDNNLPEYRAKQIAKAIFTDSVLSFENITTLSKNLRDKLSVELSLLSFTVVKVLSASNNKTFKALLKLKDGSLIETVLMSPKDELWSICVSSQVGCALGCRFCATGSLGFKRNLTAEEITDQVLFWKQFTKNSAIENRQSKFNVIYMGMGEPFLNYEEVKKSLKTLMDPDIFNIGARHISVSTSGIKEGIKKFSKDFSQVNLAISIIMPTDEQRSEFMPINTKYPLKEITKSLDYYFANNNRKVFLEYIMLAGINDSQIDAKNLIAFINKNSKPELLHVNLIRYNTASGKYKPSKIEQVTWFKNHLSKNGVSCTIRKSLGQEVQGACGQLAGK